MGLLFAVLALLPLGHLAPQWMAGRSFSPMSLATVHAFVLGTMLTTAYGVLYQFIPIAFRAPPISRHVLVWHLPAHVVGVVTMIIGFSISSYPLVGVGASALFVAFGLFSTLLVRSFVRAGNKTVVYQWLPIPLIALVLVLICGLLQVFGVGESSLFFTHVALGGFLVWGAMVMILSYKLLPMFVISHGYVASLQRTVSLYLGGSLLLMIGIWLAPVPAVANVCHVAGAVFMILGLGSFSVDVAWIFAARRGKRLVWPMYDALPALFGFVVGQGWIVLGVGFGHGHWIDDGAFVYLFGGLLLLIFSLIQKIVPFLWFEYRFSQRPERRTAPSIDAMVPTRLSQLAIALYILGTVANLCFGLIAAARGDTAGKSGLCATGAWIASIGMAVGALLLFISLLRVLRIGGRRPED
ncbi:hypothetical protein ACOALA_17405 [Alicyclobacillus acidoterrestris]|uniref:hypothetical protein n=1 Tax=Alicyclobacillus acidoterrestris TaxID=1450 RepID=UPI003F537D82